MVNLETLFKNFFDGTKISDDNFKTFAESHLQRLAANNGGGDFNTVITATTAAYGGYFGSITDTDLAATLQKSLTSSADALIGQFKDAVGVDEGLIRSKYFTANPPVYLEFFPRGVGEYTQAIKANIETLMTRFAEAASRHQGELGVPFATKFTNLRDNYIAARAAQLGKIGEVKSTTTVKKGNRSALELQVCVNLHTIAGMYPGQVDKGMSFFDQTVIRRQIDHSNDGMGRLLGNISFNGTPLPDVTVKFLNENLALSHSKNDGKYRCRNVSIGQYSVEYTKDGYTTVERQVEIVDDGDTLLDLEMVAAA
jgi:hypothetical protein